MNPRTKKLLFIPALLSAPLCQAKQYSLYLNGTPPDRTLVPFTLTSGQIPMANGSGDITGTTPLISHISGLQSALDLKAPLASPTFSGTLFTPALSAMPANIGLVTEGDSRTSIAGGGLNAGEEWPAQLAAMSSWSGRVTLHNTAVGGSVVSNMAARYTAAVYPFRPSVTGKYTVLLLFGGGNDVASDISGATTDTALAAYATQARTDGFSEIWACTDVPRASFTAAQHFEQQEFNRLVRARAGTTYDRVIDLAAAFPDPADTSLFNVDALHENAAGAKAIARYINWQTQFGVTPVAQGTAVDTNRLRAKAATVDASLTLASTGNSAPLTIGTPTVYGNIAFQPMNTQGSDFSAITAFTRASGANASSRAFSLGFNEDTAGAFSVIQSVSSTTTPSLVRFSVLGDGSATFGVSAQSPKFLLTANVGWFSGTGSPEGVLTAGIGSVYSRTDGSGTTAQYFKQTGAGNTGWQPFPSTGTGDVTAAAVFATDNRLLRSDGTLKGAKSSAVTLDNSGNLSGITSYDATTGTVRNTLNLGVLGTTPGSIVLTDGGGGNYAVTLDASVLTNFRGIHFPDGDGTLALLNSPAFTGIPIAPTASNGTSDTQLATTAFVHNVANDASNLSTGTIPNGRFPATLPAGSGANLTNLNGANISSGNIAVARIATALTTPGPIGGTTASTGAFTTLSTTGQVTHASQPRVARTDLATVYSAPTWTLQAGAHYYGTANGARTIALPGSPTDGDEIFIDQLIVSSGPITVTVPSCYRVNINSTVTSLTLTNVTNKLKFERVNSTWTLTDSGVDNVGDHVLYGNFSGGNASPGFIATDAPVAGESLTYQAAGDLQWKPMDVPNGADAGATDAYAATTVPVISAYVTGAHYRFKANTANTGTATINLCSLGAKTIVKAAGGITTTLSDNDIRAGQWVDLVYDGTNMQMQSGLGNAPSSGNGYTLQTEYQSSFSWADATTYYAGADDSPSSTYATERILIPKTGTLKAITVRVSYAAGSNETVTFYGRYDDTTDAGSLTLTMNSGTIAEATDFAVSQAVVQGHYLALKVATPTWATNPTACRMSATFYIE